MVAMEKEKQYKFGGDGGGGGGGKIEMWWQWWRKKNNVEKQKREEGKWVIVFLVVERAREKELACQESVNRNFINC